MEATCGQKWKLWEGKGRENARRVRRLGCTAARAGEGCGMCFKPVEGSEERVPQQLNHKHLPGSDSCTWGIPGSEKNA